MDLPVSDKNVFFWWPDKHGKAPDPHTITAHMFRFKIDPLADNLDLAPAETLLKEDCEFPRIDDKYLAREYTQAFFSLKDLSLPTDWSTIGPRIGGGFPPYNSIARLDVKTRQFDKYFPGATHLVQETVFISRSKNANEGDGYLLFLVSNYDSMSSELHLVDTRDFSKALAKVYLPLRLRAGLHGNWVDASELES